MSDSDEDIEDIPSMGSTMESTTRKHDDMDDDISSSTESDVSEKRVANSAVNTGRENSVSLDTDIANVMKLQKQVQSLQRQVDKEHRTKVSLENKCQSLETQKVELNNKLTGLSRDKRTLEETKIELEAKLRNLQVTLTTEQQKRTNADMIIVRTKEQLARSEDQCKTETESRQKLEVVVRSLRSQLETERQTSNQRQPSSDGDDDTSQTGSSNVQEITAELVAVKALLNQRVKEDDEDKQKIIEENEVLQKQIDKLKQDLDLDSHTLSETTVRYNLEIGSLNNRLQELLSLTDKQQHELSQAKAMLDARQKDLEEAQRKCSDMETTHRKQQEELRIDLEQCHQQLARSKEERETYATKQSETELKLTQAVNQLNVLKASNEERTSFYSDLQKQLNNEQMECEKLRDRLRAEQDANIHSRTKIELLEQRVTSLQDEATALRDSAEETKEQTLKQSEQMMTVINDVKKDYQQAQDELKNKNDDLEMKVSELMESLSAVQTERNGLRNELNDAMTSWEEDKHKLSEAFQMKSSLENDRMDLKNKLKVLEDQLEIARSRQTEVSLNAQQIASNLEAAESNAVDYSEALRAKQADFEAAVRQLANNNNKLKEVVSQSPPVERSSQTAVKLPSVEESPLSGTDSSPKGNNLQRQRKHAVKKESEIDRSHIESLEKQIAMLKLHLHSINRRLRKSNSPPDGAMDHLQKQAYQLLNQLQQSRQPVDKNLHHSNNITTSLEQARQGNQTVDNARAELEMQIRRELNKKLAILNSFLQQRSEQCDMIDRMRDENEMEIRKQIKDAEKEIRGHLVDVQPSVPTTADSMDRDGYPDVHTKDTMKMSQSMELRDLYESDDVGDHIEKSDRRRMLTGNTVDDIKLPEVSSSHVMSPSVGNHQGSSHQTTQHYVNTDLPIWLQKQLDRSIAKHLEKAPQLQLTSAHRTTTNKFISSPMSTAIMDHSVGYTSVLERNYLLI